MSEVPPPERAYPTRPIVGVGAVVLVDNRVVLIRRRYAPLAGQWNLPGGAVELGETLEEAVVRELEEETGLHVRVGPAIDTFDRIHRDADGRVQYHYVLVDFLCWPIAGELGAASDVMEATLADPADLGPYNLTDKAREVIAKAIALGKCNEE